MPVAVTPILVVYISIFFVVYDDLSSIINVLCKFYSTISSMCFRCFAFLVEFATASRVPASPCHILKVIVNSVGGPRLSCCLDNNPVSDNNGSYHLPRNSGFGSSHYRPIAFSTHLRFRSDIGRRTNHHSGVKAARFTV